MGSIWVGRHQQLDVPVAVKFMAPQLAASADARARFEREAKASALLRSANAVQIHDYGVEGDVPFIVMELLDGEDLAARLRRERRLTPAVTYAILEQAGRALRGAHEMGLIHRDLKPANLFLARQAGGEEIVKVLDFGIAKAQGLATDGHATKTGALLGSPHYMSPEQVRSSHKVDHRTDVWALGVIAFEAMTGRLPFSGDEVGEVLVEVCTAPIPRPSSIAPDLGPDVDRFFDRALAREPEQRFQSVGELLGALAALAGAAQAPAAMAPQPLVPAGATGVTTAPSHTPAPSMGTLSPSEHTQRRPAAPSRGARMAILLTLSGVVLVVGVAGFLAVRSTPGADGADVQPSQPSQGIATASPELPGAPASAAPTPSVSPAPPPSEEPAPTATAAPSTTASASSTPAPRRAKPGRARKSDDLLNHM